VLWNEQQRQCRFLKINVLGGSKIKFFIVNAGNVFFDLYTEHQVL